MTINDRYRICCLNGECSRQGVSLAWSTGNYIDLSRDENKRYNRNGVQLSPKSVQIGAEEWKCGGKRQMMRDGANAAKTAGVSVSVCPSGAAWQYCYDCE